MQIRSYRWLALNLLAKISLSENSYKTSINASDLSKIFHILLDEMKFDHSQISNCLNILVFLSDRFKGDKELFLLADQLSDFILLWSTIKSREVKVPFARFFVNLTGSNSCNLAFERDSAFVNFIMKTAHMLLEDLSDIDLLLLFLGVSINLAEHSLRIREYICDLGKLSSNFKKSVHQFYRN